jgi:hypothetical protein
MRNTGRKLLTMGLAALYSGIALLGYGLHELAPHHHHHPAAQAHSHAGCTHTRHHAPLPETPGFSDSHECEVCAFLDQLQSDRPQLAADITWQPTISATVEVAPQVHAITSLGPAAPRGPPALIG